MDLTNAYDLRAQSVRRGFMLTDDRQSVVIRDEYELNTGDNTLYWFMHMQNADVEIKDSNTAEITVDGKDGHIVVSDGCGIGRTFGDACGAYGEQWRSIG